MLELGIIVVVGAVFVAGIFIQSQQGGPTVTVGSNDSTKACEDLCNQWDARRGDRCRAQQALATAQNSRDALSVQFGMMAALAVAALAAAFAALVLAPWLAPALFIVAAAAALAADLVLG